APLAGKTNTKLGL
ncbi:unnamed protein product, partial [Rotaria sordida]